MKRHFLTLISTIFAAIICAGCHETEIRPDTPEGNVRAAWKIINDRYCFLNEKGLDWDEVGRQYIERANNGMSSRELFDLISEMLDTLMDGHTNLSSPYGSSYYRKWWSDYPQNYDKRLIQQYYFNFNYQTLGPWDYAWLPGDIGYIHCSTFEYGLGNGNIDLVLSYFSTARGLILDVRDNSGGNLTNVETIVSHFIHDKILAGYMIHKTGPGHNDFSEPFPYYFYPAGKGHLRWDKPVMVLTNRATFSAANNFVSIMKGLPQVTICGATTGGGSGMPFNSELPNGWSIRFSACSILDAEGRVTEFGVEPTPGYALDMDVTSQLSGHDSILDLAISSI